MHVTEPLFAILINLHVAAIDLPYRIWKICKNCAPPLPTKHYSKPFLFVLRNIYMLWRGTAHFVFVPRQVPVCPCWCVGLCALLHSVSSYSGETRVRPPGGTSSSASQTSFSHQDLWICGPLPAWSSRTQIWTCRKSLKYIILRKQGQNYQRLLS